MKWSSADINFLKTNFLKLKNKNISIELKRTLSGVATKASKLGLSKKNNIMDSFFKLDSKEFVYILGLIWADASLTKYSVTLETVLEDSLYFEKIVDKVCKYKIYKRNRVGMRPQQNIAIHSKTLIKFLEKHNFKNKSFDSPAMILKKIPKNLVMYFYRGLIDGDGCFYFNKKQYLRQFILSGSYQQDWTYMEKLFTDLGICKYKIVRVIKDNNKFSFIRITNQKEIKKLGGFLYGNFDGIGLERKHKKYLSIIE